jgi:hypothetical protein
VRKIQILLSIVGRAVLLLPSAKGGTLALDIIGGTGNAGSGGTQSLGWQFQVNTPILVDGLGFWDSEDTEPRRRNLPRFHSGAPVFGNRPFHG